MSLNRRYPYGKKYEERTAFIMDRSRNIALMPQWMRGVIVGPGNPLWARRRDRTEGAVSGMAGGLAL